MRGEDCPTYRSRFRGRMFRRLVRWSLQTFLPLLFCLGSGGLYGQTLNDISNGEPCWGPLIGIHTGEYFFLEGGFGYARTSSHGHGLFSMTGFTLSAEVKPGENVILAPRATLWFTILAAMGIGAGYYTDFDDGTVVIQPEFGLGFAGGRVTWRINLPLGKEIEGLNTSDFSVSLFLPVL